MFVKLVQFFIGQIFQFPALFREQCFFRIALRAYRDTLPAAIERRPQRARRRRPVKMKLGELFEAPATPTTIEATDTIPLLAPKDGGAEPIEPRARIGRRMRFIMRVMGMVHDSHIRYIILQKTTPQPDIPWRRFSSMLHLCRYYQVHELDSRRHGGKIRQVPSIFEERLSESVAQLYPHYQPPDDDLFAFDGLGRRAAKAESTRRSMINRASATENCCRTSPLIWLSVML